MGYRSLVVLPEEMSAERFEKIRAYGAEVVATPGSESNVKEIYDKVQASCAQTPQQPDPQPVRGVRRTTASTSTARRPPRVEVARRAWACSVGAFVSAMGSAGTIAAGEALKRQHPGAATVAVEPVQCPTLFNVGFGAHRIEGIGDKHVTWIHNVWATDLLVCVDDQECLEGLQLLQEGTETLAAEGVDRRAGARAGSACSASAACATCWPPSRPRATTGSGPKDAVVTVATDGFDRYPSVLRRLDRRAGPHDAGTRRAAGSPSSAARRWTGSWKARARCAAAGTTRSTSPGWSSRARRSTSCARRRTRPSGCAHQERAAEIDRGIRERRSDGAAPDVDRPRLPALRAALPPRSRRPVPALRPRGRARRRCSTCARAAAHADPPRAGHAAARPSGATASCCPCRPARGGRRCPWAGRRSPRRRGWPPGRACARLRVKDEGRNPTASFKDRASAVGVARALAAKRARGGLRLHRQRGFVAGRRRRPAWGSRAVIFVPEFAPEPKVAQLLIFGARVHPREGHLRRDLGAVPARLRALRLVQPQRGREPVAGRGQEDLRPRDRASRPAPRCRTGWRCRWATAARIAGIWKGLREMHALGFIPRLPRMLGVQAEGARPLVDAFREGRRPRRRRRRETLADSICVGHPRNWRKALRAVRESGGAFVAVPDEAILDAMREAGRRAGVFGEPAGVAGLAGLRQAVEEGIVGRRETRAGGGDRQRAQGRADRDARRRRAGDPAPRRRRAGRPPARAPV